MGSAGEAESRERDGEDGSSAAPEGPCRPGRRLDAPLLLKHPLFRHVFIDRRVLRTIRGLVRADALWLITLGALIGCCAGVVVIAMTRATLLIHALLFGVAGGRLSGLDVLEPWRCMMPVFGGLTLGLFGLLIQDRLPSRPVDPIEANALHGGCMSLRQSALLAVQTVISNGAGASIGLEAGFSQLASALGARCGRMLRVQRADMRLLVGCGAAGAIGAAFDAPLAGAFYAFELVIGSYTMANLTPVVLASICATGVLSLTGGGLPAVHVDALAIVRLRDCIPLALLGATSSFVGITLMRAVTVMEEGFRRSRLPEWSRPAVGGAMLGGLALLSPSVLSSGHMAMRAGLMDILPLGRALWLLILKAAASALSIGAGFRGGLFFASLYLGVLNGTAFGDVMALIGIDPVPVPVCAVAGMCALAVAVIGGPMTMIFLALETTESFPLMVAVTISALTSSVMTRRMFGYSFATWRFHLRGESIRSAVDIGRVRSLTVERVMRHDAPTIRLDATVAEARVRFAPDQPRHIVLLDREGRYAGLVAGDAYRAVGLPEDEPLSRLLVDPGHTLRPNQSVRDALATFERVRVPALVVLGGGGQVVGLLTERYVLRRFAGELERSWRDLAGDV